MTKSQKETPSPEEQQSEPEPKKFDPFEPIDFAKQKGRHFVNSDYLDSKNNIKVDDSLKVACPRCQGRWWIETSVGRFQAEVAVSPGARLPVVGTPDGLAGYFVYKCLGCDYLLVPKPSGARPVYAKSAHSQFARMIEQKNKATAENEVEDKEL